MFPKHKGTVAEPFEFISFPLSPAAFGLDQWKSPTHSFWTPQKKQEYETIHFYASHWDRFSLQWDALCHKLEAVSALSCSSSSVYAEVVWNPAIILKYVLLREPLQLK